jgi:hypothetical protein
VQYAAESWDRQRRVIVKAEHTDKGSNPRFVVTNLNRIQPLYDEVYCARGRWRTGRWNSSYLFSD